MHVRDREEEEEDEPRRASYSHTGGGQAPPPPPSWQPLALLPCRGTRGASTLGKETEEERNKEGASRGLGMKEIMNKKKKNDKWVPHISS